jgi:hypothetical protein
MSCPTVSFKDAVMPSNDENTLGLTNLDAHGNCPVGRQQEMSPRCSDDDTLGLSLAAKLGSIMPVRGKDTSKD